jgi:TonB family protein
VAHYPIADPDSDGLDSASRENPLIEMPRAGAGKSAGFESDLAQLTAKFSSDEGGHLSAELSADLALEIVLHEIVEQACAATGASGVAVILEWDGEWVCRASSGRSAPELGARLGRDSGLTAECIKTRRVQRCDDIENDSRVDIDACRSLGVRSLIMLPLLQGEKPIGVLGAFSPSLSAFGEAEERNLQALSNYVVRNLALASEPQPSEPLVVADQATENMPHRRSLTEQKAPPAPAVVNLQRQDKDKKDKEDKKEDKKVVSFPSENKERKHVADEPSGRFEDQAETGQPHRSFKIATGILTAVVLTFAVFLTVVASQRLSGRKTSRRNLPATSPPASDLASQGHENRSIGAQSNETERNEDRNHENPGTLEIVQSDSNPGDGAHAAEPPTEAGSLTVYENEKQVFHMPAGSENHDTNAAAGNAVDSHAPAAAAQGQRIYQLSAEAAQDELLHRVDPIYPEQARQQRIEGIVVMTVRAGRDGRVRDVKLVGGQPLLVQAALTAVKQWQFKPHLVNGQPVETQTRITLTFELPRENH